MVEETIYCLNYFYNINLWDPLCFGHIYLFVFVSLFIVQIKYFVKIVTNLFLELIPIWVCFIGEQSEVSWLLSVLRETESDIRDGEEQLLLFWLLLCVTSSDKESVSFVSSEANKQTQAINSHQESVKYFAVMTNTIYIVLVQHMRGDPTKKMEFIYKKLYIYPYMFKRQFTFKVLSIWWIHLIKISFPLFKTVLNLLILMPFNASVFFVSPLPHQQNISLLRTFLYPVKQKKSRGERWGE